MAVFRVKWVVFIIDSVIHFSIFAQLLKNTGIVMICDIYPVFMHVFLIYVYQN